MPLLVRELLSGGLLHDDVKTILGQGGLTAYCSEPFFNPGGHDEPLEWKPGATASADPQVLASIKTPFSPEGGLKLLTGNLGRSIIKVSAVAKSHQKLRAPAVVLSHQDELKEKFEAGELERDFVAVVRFQGPKANGMPELHKLVPYLGILQDRGFKVALVTDGRMSGASGKIPAAIHLSPEALDQGPIAKLRDGDTIELDAEAGALNVHAADFDSRPAIPGDGQPTQGMGREMFQVFRNQVSAAEDGASVFQQ